VSFHDQVALKARLDGNTSVQFRTAAQKHANATWVYLIIAGVVWYFTSWQWALIPGALAVYVAIQSISATAVAIRLEKYERSRDTAL
jgi:membrane protein YdbS with pleckstrin-like domain